MSIVYRNKFFGRQLVCIFLICCILTSTIVCHAATSDYSLDEIGMSLKMPSDLVVFTRDISASDPNLVAYGLTKDGLYSLMLERSIYLNAWDELSSFEIVITMIDSPLSDFNLFSDTVLSTLATALADEYKTMGITLMKQDFYQHEQAKFLKLYISQPNNGDTAYGLQYYTVYDDKAINITIHSYDGTIGTEKEALIKSIVDSVQFNTPPQKPATPVDSPAFVYTDTISGVQFTVPANWSEEPMMEQRDFIDAKFVSNKEDGLMIIYTSEDIFGSEAYQDELTVFERLTLSRSKLNNDFATKEDIAILCNCTSDEISTVSLGEAEYFKVEVVVSATVEGVLLSSPTTYLIRFENGYLHMFQFNSFSDNKLYSDFERLVASTKYPEVVTENGIGGTMAVVVVAGLILGVAAVIHNRTKHKESEQQINSQIASLPNVEPEQQQELPVQNCFDTGLNDNSVPCNEELKTVTLGENTINTVPPTNEGREISYCHKCGNKVTADSLFCNKCGTKIVRG